MSGSKELTVAPLRPRKNPSSPASCHRCGGCVSSWQPCHALGRNRSRSRYRPVSASGLPEVELETHLPAQGSEGGSLGPTLQLVQTLDDRGCDPLARHADGGIERIRRYVDSNLPQARRHGVQAKDMAD